MSQNSIRDGPAFVASHSTKGTDQSRIVVGSEHNSFVSGVIWRAGITGDAVVLSALSDREAEEYARDQEAMAALPWKADRQQQIKEHRRAKGAI